VRLWRGHVVHPENLVTELMTEPSEFVLELRRQHVIECFMFLDQLKQSLHTFAMSASGAHVVTAKQALQALKCADHTLTDDQRYLYVLRGFDCRLPDPPSVTHGERAHLADADSRPPEAEVDPSIEPAEEDVEVIPEDVEDAMKLAGVFYKTRKLLQDHMKALLEEAETVAADVFVQRLSAAGVTRGADMWNPELSIRQICLESGHQSVRSMTATAPLQEFLGTGGSGGGGSTDAGAAGEEVGLQRHAVEDSQMMAGSLTEGSSMMASIEPVDRYHAHAVAGRDVQELSIGYTKLGLLHWLACPG